MSLKTQIQTDVKDTMRAKDKFRLGVLRMLTAAIKQREVDERIELDDDQTLAVLEKMVKQRRDASKQYQDADRVDLSEVEEKELKVLAGFMPEPLGADKIAKLITNAISTTGATNMKDMGKVMGIIKPQVQGRVDMGQISQQIRQHLS